MLMVAIFAAAAAAPAIEAVLADAQAQDARIAAIAYRLQTRAGALCPAPVMLTGLVLHHRAQYGGAFAATATRIFGLGDYPRVLAIVPGSAADRAGIRVGDEVRGVGDHRLLPDRLTGKGYAPLDYVETQLESAMAAPEPVITVRRNEAELRLPLRGDRGCASRIQVVAGRQRNAKADGRFVQINDSIITETRDDAELAFVVAHELAHNILGHRVLLDARGRGRQLVFETEVAADRLGVALMKAAGYDPFAAPRFWSRFGRKTGAGIFSDGSHMRTRPRIEFLERVAAEP